MSQLFVPGTADPSEVLTGNTFSAGTYYIAPGTMANNGALDIAPGNVVKSIPAGYHNGAGRVLTDGNLLAANIKTGVTIFGVAGSLIPGKRSASGSGTLNASFQAVVSGLAFQPSLIIIEWAVQSGLNYRKVYYGGTFNSSINTLSYAYQNSSSSATLNVTDGWTITSSGFTTGTVNATSGQSFNWYAIE